MDIDLSYYVVVKDRQYLQRITKAKRPVFTPMKYDAVPIDFQRDAVRIAEKIGGMVVGFNPLTGEMI